MPLQDLCRDRPCEGKPPVPGDSRPAGYGPSRMTGIARAAALDPRSRRRVGALGRARPDSDAERTLVPAPPPQQDDRGGQHAAGAADPALPADQAARADRPAQLRPAGDGGDRRRGQGHRHPARGAEPAGGALRPRDRALLQRLRLLPHRLSRGQARGGEPLPRAPRLFRRRGAGPHRARRQRRLRHEPPQQHGLRDRRLHGGASFGAELCRRRVGAGLAAPHAGALARRVLRAPQLGQPPLPPGARLLREGCDRRRRGPGGLPRGRPQPRRPPAQAQARPHQLHGLVLRPRRLPRSRLRARRHQLRPCAGGPHAGARAGSRRAPARARRACSRPQRASSPTTWAS